MARKYLIKHKHNYIQSYRFGKNQQRNKLWNNKSKFFFLDSWNDEIILVKKPKMKTNAVEFMYEESCYKSSSSKYEKPNSNINISKTSHLPSDMLWFSLEKWWHCAQWIDNLQVPWNNPWFRTTRMEWQNNIKRKVRHVH